MSVCSHSGATFLRHSFVFLSRASSIISSGWATHSLVGRAIRGSTMEQSEGTNTLGLSPAPPCSAVGLSFSCRMLETIGAPWWQL